MSESENTLWDTASAVLRFLWENPYIPGVIVALIGANIGWRKLTIRYNASGRPLPPLGFTVKRVLRAMYLEDTTPVVNRPASLARKLVWLTWRRYWIAATILAVVLASRVTSPLPDNLDYSLLVLISYMGIHGAMHLRRVFQIRHRILMQMFEVAAAECRYLKGAELNPWGYIQISKWRDLYSPDTTVIMFPPRYRSEEPQNREAFELNFNGTVSDAHSWMYKWESSNNRVIAEPVPFIVEQAPYPFPDTHPWNEFPVGAAAGGKEAIIDVKTYPHLLIAGSTGSGKSVTQRTLLLHALQSPEWRVMLIDPKRVELSAYATHPHVIRVATELEESTELLEQLEQEMQSRYERMKNEGVNFFKDMRSAPPAILMMVDETFALLSPENIKSEEGKERDEMHARCTVLIGSIARLGRAAGVHMMLATQRPDAKVIPGETRALDLTTPLLLADGSWSSVEQVGVGDVLLDMQGQPTTVTGVTEVMMQQRCYRVVLADGSAVVADAGHLWVTGESRMHASTRTGLRVLTTEEVHQLLFVEQREVWLPAVGSHEMVSFPAVPARRVVDVIPHETVPVKCVAVDSPSRTFLAGRNLLPTHNSNLDARIAQGRMDTTPSLMTLDSNEATKIPPIKGRAVLRTGNDYTHFQAYFLPPDVLPQVLEMSAALATGMISPEDLTPAEEEKPSRLKGKFRLPAPPQHVTAKIRGWVAKREEQVQRNEEQARRFATEKKRKQKKVKDSRDSAEMMEPADSAEMSAPSERRRRKPRPVAPSEEPASQDEYREQPRFREEHGEEIDLDDPYISDFAGTDEFLNTDLDGEFLSDYQRLNGDPAEEVLEDRRGGSPVPPSFSPENPTTSPLEPIQPSVEDLPGIPDPNWLPSFEDAPEIPDAPTTTPIPESPAPPVSTIPPAPDPIPVPSGQPPIAEPSGYAASPANPVNPANPQHGTDDYDNYVPVDDDPFDQVPEAPWMDEPAVPLPPASGRPGPFGLPAPEQPDPAWNTPEPAPSPAVSSPPLPPPPPPPATRTRKRGNIPPPPPPPAAPSNTP